jgi:MoaA/NifB/PqqE/SkfB family radical SAM enzyme
LNLFFSWGIFDAEKKMTRLKNFYFLIRTLWRHPSMVRMHPALNWFFLRYIGNFKIKNQAGHWIVHSHLPPLNHKAFGRFINEHLLKRVGGPSHAQIGLTNACPQRCAYCYNRDRRGQAMDTETILRAVRELKEMGVCWLGLTGGEPLLNPDIARIVSSAAQGCAIKLFTTGSTLTREKARKLKEAGLFSVSVSLDHWLPEIHDHNRGLEGAFATALEAIDIFKKTGGIQVGVSAVIGMEMIRRGQVEEFLEFLQGLGVDEAWLCEAKPAVAAFRDENLVISEADQSQLVRIQNHYNRRRGMTVNHLGHFESREFFGCNAGNKMVYVDACGEVSPCVFTPMTFGNIRDRSLKEIFAEMKSHFPSDDTCFINKNYHRIGAASRGQGFLNAAESLQVMRQVEFGRLSGFFRLYLRDKKGK